MLFNQSYKQINYPIRLVIGKPHDFAKHEKEHGHKQVHNINFGH